MIATILGWLAGKVAGPVAACVAVLAVAGFLYQTALILILGPRPTRTYHTALP